MAQLLVQGIERGLNGDDEFDWRAEEGGGNRGGSKGGVADIGIINWVRRGFSRFTNATNPLFVVMAWPRRQNAKKVAVDGGVAAEQAAAGRPLLTD